MDNALLVVSVTAMFCLTLVVLSASGATSVPPSSNGNQHSVNALVRVLMEIVKHLK